MNELPQKVIAYLAKYGLKFRNIEPEQRSIYKNIVVIPCLAEYDNIRHCLISLSENDSKYFSSTLILIVINNKASADAGIIKNNYRTRDFVRRLINGSPDDTVEIKIIRSGLNIAFIDAFTEGNEMPDNTGGVGLARKIGMDIALTLFDYIKPGKNILICLDADCTVSPNYLTSVSVQFNTNFISAASINFQHPLEGESEETAAIICYEIFLRYYVAGLKYAGSPYAFHTIGSAMACDAEAYIKTEGMNKKQAAEDFYFLEKISKNYLVQNIRDAVVYPSSRSSWRVPFGTGQRVGRFLRKEQYEYLLFDPNSFKVLREWLSVFIAAEKMPIDELLKAARDIEPELERFLINQNFSNDMERIIKNSQSEKQLGIQKQRWFDGFRTLKLLHHLRDTSMPLMNMFDALDIFFKMSFVNYSVKRKEKVPPLEIQNQYLLQLRESENNPVLL